MFTDGKQIMEKYGMPYLIPAKIVTIYAHVCHSGIKLIPLLRAYTQGLSAIELLSPPKYFNLLKFPVDCVSIECPLEGDQSSCVPYESWQVLSDNYSYSCNHLCILVQRNCGHEGLDSQRASETII